VSAYELDVPELYAHLEHKRRQASRSWRAIAADLGLPASTFSRMKAGHRPDADALVTLIAWLDIDLAYVTKPTEPTA
jgi:hypothetical protein